MESEPLTLLLEFARAQESDDPYAFHFSAQQYLLRSPGGGFENAELSWDQGLLGDLDAIRLPGRSPELMQRVGEALRRFLEPADWASSEVAILKAVQEGRPIVLTIRSAAAELYALPWELLTLKTTGQHLGELARLLLRYEWPETTTTPPSPTAQSEGGRICFAWSAAGGTVPAAEHLSAIQTAGKDGFLDFSRDTDVLAHVSCSRLVAALNAAQQKGPPISVLHLLCHGTADGQTFGLALEADGPDGEGANVVVDAGRLRQLLAPFADMVRLVVLAACDSGNAGTLGNQLGSVAQTLHRAGIANVLASRYPLSMSGSIHMAEKLYQELLRGPASLESALCSVRRRLAQDTQLFDWASLQFYAREADGSDSRPLVIRPYRGLLAFQPEHHRFFFGRQRAIEELLQDLTDLTTSGRPRFMIVAGASGTGKSSMVFAGALPRLLATNPNIRVARLRPGSDPEATLETVLADLQSVKGSGEDASPAYLLVDQLEDIFTNVSDAGRRQSFIQKLWNLASSPTSAMHVIATMRIDFIGRCGEIRVDATGRGLDTVAYDEAHRVFLTLPSPSELRQAIVKPAHAVGVELEDGLVQRLVQDVGSEPGALPLLEATLDSLWQQRRGRIMTQSAYDALGGMAGALQSRAQELYNSLSSAEQQVAKRLLLHLVGIAEDTGLTTRRCVPLEKVRPPASKDMSRGASKDQDAFDHVLEKFVEARLLVRSGRDATSPERSRPDWSHESGLLRVPTSQVELLLRSHPPTGETGVRIEVAHESLVRKWELLRDWVHQDRRMLAELEKLEGWIRQYREMGTLLVGSQLGYAAEVMRRYPQDLPPGANTLLSQSRKLSERRKRFRDLTWLASVLIGIAVAGFGWTSYREVTQARAFGKLARDALRLNTIHDGSDGWQTRMALLRESEGSPDTLPPGWLPTAVSTLYQADSRELTLGGTAAAGSSSAQAIAISSDGRRLAALSAESGILLAGVDEVGVPRVLAHGESPTTAVTLSRSGAHLAAATQDRTIRIFSTAGDTEPRILKTPDQEGQDVEAITFSADGQLLAATCRDHVVRQWKLDGEIPRTSQPHPSPVRTVSYSPNGQYLLTGCDDGIVRIWQTDRDELWKSFPAQASPVLAAAYSPDGTRIATGTSSGKLSLFQVSDQHRLASLDLGQSVVSVSFSPNNQYIAAAAADRLWLFAADGRPLVALPHPSSAVPLSIEFSADSRSLFAVLKGHRLRVLPVNLEPMSLLRRFWRDGRCLEPKTRRLRLLDSVAAAKQNLDNCNTMLECLTPAQPGALAAAGAVAQDPFPACLSAFQRRQANIYQGMLLPREEIAGLKNTFFSH